MSEIKNKIRKMDDLELIRYVQDFNKPDRDSFYSEDFKREINKEMVRRGEIKIANIKKGNKFGI